MSLFVIIVKFFVFFNIFYFINVSQVSAAKTLSPGDIIIKCNEYFRYVTNLYSYQHDSRFFSLLNIAFHNSLNIINYKYELWEENNIDYDDILSSYNLNQISKSSLMLGICYEIRKHVIENDLQSITNEPWNTPSDRIIMLNDLNIFINNLKLQIKQNETHINNGYNLGIDIANIIINDRINDGWNDIVEPQMGTWPYQPGQWYSALYSDGFTPSEVGSFYPQFVYAEPFGIPSNKSYFDVKPRPALNTKEFEMNYQDVYINGNVNNPYNIRTETKTNEANAIGAGPPHIWTNVFADKIIKNNIKDLSNHDIAYIYAQQSMNTYDALLHNVYWKKRHNNDRPIQLIHNGGGSQYPQYIADENWINIGFEPEYPAGHPENTAAGVEAIRLALIEIGIIEEDDDNIPGGTECISICHGPTAEFTKGLMSSCSSYLTFKTFNEFKDLIVDGRVYIGLHYKVSGQVGKQLGNEIAAYNIENHMRKVT